MNDTDVGKLEERVRWLERDNRNLKQTLDFARKELWKADRRAADFADRLANQSKLGRFIEKG